MDMQRKFGLAAVLGAAALLGACSGDDDSTPAAPVGSSVPAGASQDSAGLTAYLRSLVASTDADLLEPADLGAFTPPTQAATETEEPKEI